MRFIGLEPFRSPADVEVRFSGRSYDLHNSGWLQELSLAPARRVLTARWGIEAPPNSEVREVLASVTLTFDGVTRVTAEGMILGDSSDSASTELEHISFMPERNGPNLIALHFVDGGIIEFRAEQCSAEIVGGVSEGPAHSA